MIAPFFGVPCPFQTKSHAQEPRFFLCVSDPKCSSTGSRVDCERKTQTGTNFQFLLVQVVDGGSVCRKKFQVSEFDTLDVVAVVVECIPCVSHQKASACSHSEACGSILNMWVVNELNSAEISSVEVNAENLETTTTCFADPCLVS